ncbi:MAG TPA: ATP-dependent DNA ligase, partial [Acidimicrobiia bacterium]
TPLTWDEVATIEPDGIRLGDVAARLAADPWEGMPTLDLAPASESVGRALEEAGIVLEPFDRFRS